MTREIVENSDPEGWLIPFDQLWRHDMEVIADQLYTVKALTDPLYREALEAVIHEKQKELTERAKRQHRRP
jgi:hypothetical protein